MLTHIWPWAVRVQQVFLHSPGTPKLKSSKKASAEARSVYVHEEEELLKIKVFCMEVGPGPGPAPPDAQAHREQFPDTALWLLQTLAVLCSGLTRI